MPWNRSPDGHGWVRSHRFLRTAPVATSARLGHHGTTEDYPTVGDRQVQQPVPFTGTRSGYKGAPNFTHATPSWSTLLLPVFTFNTHPPEPSLSSIKFSDTGETSSNPSQKTEISLLP